MAKNRFLKTETKGLDFSDPVTRKMVAEKLGLSVKEKPKADFLGRLGSFLGAFETGNAAYEFLKTGDVGKAVATYGQDIVSGITGAFTGDVNSNKKTWKDVLRKTGLNGVEADVVGFLGDVLLDPTTYVSFGVGKGAQLGGKTLTKKGSKFAGNFFERARSEIADIAKKSIDKLDPDELVEATTTFALKNKIPTKSALGVMNVPEILEAYSIKKLNKLAEKGVQVYKENAMRFMGKEIARTPEIVTKIGSAIVDPTELMAKYAKNAPIISSAIKGASDVVNRVVGGLGRIFDNTFEARLNNLGNFDKNVKDTLNFIEVLKTKTGLDEKDIIKKLQNIDADMRLFPILVEKTNPLDIDDPILRKEYQKYLKRVNDVTDSELAKFFGVSMDKATDDVKGTLKEFAIAFDSRDMNKARQLAQGLPDGKYGEAMAKVLQDAKDVARYKLRNDTLEYIKKIEFNGKSGIMDKLIKMKNPKTANIKSLLDKIPDDKAKELLNKYVDEWSDFTGKYTKIGVSWVLNETDNFAKTAAEFQEESLYRMQVLKMLDLPNLAEALHRKVLEIKGVPVQFVGENGSVKMGKSMSAEKVLGKRKFELLIQGVQEGEILYAMEKHLKKDGKFIEWDSLTKKQQRETREAVIGDVLETQVRFIAAKQLHEFLQWTKTGAMLDTGEKLVLQAEGSNVTDAQKIEAKRLMEEEGWRAPIGIGKVMKGYIMPAEAAKMIEETHKAFFTDKGMNEFLRLYDAVNSMWKTSVTTWFPAFHVRNMMGNVFSNLMADVKNPTVYMDAIKLQRYTNALASGASKKKLLEMGNRKIGNYTYAEILDLAEKYGVVSSSVWEEASEGLLRSRPGVTKRFNPLSKDFVVTKVMGGIGNATEGNARLAHFIDKLKKGYGIRDAADSVKKTLFDYGDLTPTEKNLFRRLIPFYTWSRKNAEFMTRMVAANPGKFAGFLKGLRDIQGVFGDAEESDIEKLPAWARNGYFYIKDKENLAAITGLGLPIEGYGAFMDQLLTTGEQPLLSSLAPIPKGIVERSTGISLFTGKKISEDTSGKKFRNMPNFVKDLVGYREIEREKKDGTKYIEYIVNPDAKYYINLFLGRTVADSEKILATMEEGDKGALIGLLTGIKRHNFNISAEEAKREKEAAEELLNYLVSSGMATTFTVTSLNKDTKETLGIDVKR